MMNNHDNKVEIAVHAYTASSEVPAFSIATMAADGKPCARRFISGVGVVTHSPAHFPNNLHGKTVVFCGYADAEIEKSIKTCVNNLCCIPGAPEPLFACCGNLAIIINALRRLHLEVGMRVAIEADEQTFALVSAIVTSLGCAAARASGNLSEVPADKGIVVNKLRPCISRFCSKTAEIACIGAAAELENAGLETFIFVQEAGALSCEENYACGGDAIPAAYITNSVSQNLQAAAGLLLRQAVCENDLGHFAPIVLASGTKVLPEGTPTQAAKAWPFADHVAGLYASHITPGVLSLSAHLPHTEENARALSALLDRILPAGPKEKSVHRCENAVIALFQGADGSAVSCQYFNSGETRLRLEMHFDATTVLYENDTLHIYCGAAAPVCSRYAPGEVLLKHAGQGVGKWYVDLEAKA